ncbi:hypothetical protein IL306_006381 [Fusarium sp. DS 682]|nr:hypothetical protein IL306_006381 [Fusarium sp. DS 682]
MRPKALAPSPQQPILKIPGPIFLPPNLFILTTTLFCQHTANNFYCQTTLTLYTQSTSVKHSSVPVRLLSLYHISMIISNHMTALRIMPPKKTADQDGSPIGLTDGELRFIKAIFDNMVQKPDADWDAVAQTVSLKDAKCAKERFRQMSVRHGWRSDGAASGASPRKSTASVEKAKKPRVPRTPRKKSAKKADEDDEDVKEETKPEEEKQKIKAEAEEDDDTN